MLKAEHWGLNCTSQLIITQGDNSHLPSCSETCCCSMENRPYSKSCLKKNTKTVLNTSSPFYVVDQLAIFMTSANFCCHQKNVGYKGKIWCKGVWVFQLWWSEHENWQMKKTRYKNKNKWNHTKSWFVTKRLNWLSEQP